MIINSKFLLVSLFMLCSCACFSQTTWKSQKYAYTVEIPEGFYLRKAIGKNVDLSINNDELTSSINIVVKDASVEIPNLEEFSLWDFDLDSYFQEMESGSRQWGLNLRMVDYGKATIAGYEALWYHSIVVGDNYSMNYQVLVGKYFYTITIMCPEYDKEKIMSIWYRFINQIKFENIKKVTL